MELLSELIQRSSARLASSYAARQKPISLAASSADEHYLCQSIIDIGHAMSAATRE